MQRLLLALLTSALLLPVLPTAVAVQPTDDWLQECVTGTVDACASGGSLCMVTGGCCLWPDPFITCGSGGDEALAFGAAVTVYAPWIIEVVSPATTAFPGQNRVTLANAEVDVGSLVSLSAQAFEAKANKGPFPAPMPQGAGPYASATDGHVRIEVPSYIIEAHALESDASYDTQQGTYALSSSVGRLVVNGFTIISAAVSPNSVVTLGSSLLCWGLPQVTLVLNEQQPHGQGGMTVTALRVTVLDEVTCTPAADVWLAGAAARP